MTDLTPERLEEIERKLRLDRCAWCGWPIYASPDEGCAEDNCSQRPRPVAHDAELHNDLRALVRMARRALELELELDRVKAWARGGWDSAAKTLGIVSPIDRKDTP